MVCSRKGGSGKTTLAWNMAALSGGLVVDADPQGSLRLAKDVPVLTSPGPQVLADLKEAETKHPLVWLDTAPTLDARTLSLMDGSDYFLLPTAASALGLEATRYTLQEIGRKGRLADALVVFALTAPRPDQTYLSGVAEALAAGGVAVAHTKITRRVEVEVAPSFGASVVTHRPNGKAVDELQQLWSELKALWGLKHARLA
jgi:cellulose biosynthesis protein BcsQ